MRASRFILLVAVGLSLVGCGGAVAVQPTPTIAPSPVPVPPSPTPVPTCPSEAASFLASAGPIAAEWSDAVTLADSTPRMSLAGPIQSLQTIKRKAEALDAPACVAHVKSGLTGAMGTTIDSYLTFMSSSNDDAARTGLILATSQLQTVTSHIKALRALAATGVPSEFAVTPDELKAAYAPDGVTFTERMLTTGEPTLTSTLMPHDAVVEAMGKPAIHQASVTFTYTGANADELAPATTMASRVTPTWTDAANWIAANVKNTGTTETLAGPVYAVLVVDRTSNIVTLSLLAYPRQ